MCLKKTIVLCCSLIFFIIGISIITMSITLGKEMVDNFYAVGNNVVTAYDPEEYRLVFTLSVIKNMLIGTIVSVISCVGIILSLKTNKRT